MSLNHTSVLSQPKPHREKQHICLSSFFLRKNRSFSLPVKGLALFLNEIEDDSSCRGGSRSYSAHAPSLVCLFVLSHIPIPLPVVLSPLFRLERSLALASGTWCRPWLALPAGQTCVDANILAQSRSDSLLGDTCSRSEGALPTAEPSYHCIASPKRKAGLCRRPEDLRRKAQAWGAVTNVGKATWTSKGPYFLNKVFFFFFFWGPAYAVEVSGPRD